MTEKNKNPFINSAKGLIPYLLTPAMVLFLVWSSAEYKTESKHKQFSTAEIKVKTEEHINTTPNDFEMYQALGKFDSVLQFQKTYNENTEANRKRKDSLSQLDRVTIYQLKQAVEKIEQKIDNE